jgi:hypothetical protein
LEKCDIIKESGAKCAILPGHSFLKKVLTKRKNGDIIKVQKERSKTK